MEETFGKKLKDIEDMFKQEQQKIRKLEEKIQKFDIESEQLKCESCEFTTTSKKGLKTHIKRKHSVANSDLYPVSCELCEEELESKSKMKIHMKSHTYKSQNSENSKFKCVECDFIGQSEWTMQIHYGKNHNNGNIECGLCDYKVKDLECLEMHLTTCELYECANCEKGFRHISEIKKHILEEEDNSSICGSANIFHVKIDRKNPIETSWKEYKQKELF